MRVDRPGFEEALAEQRDRSRSRQEGRPGAPGRADGALRRDRAASRRHAVPRLRDDERRRAGRGDPARRHRVPGARGRARGRAAGRGRRGGRAGPRPDAVLREGGGQVGDQRRASATRRRATLLFTVEDTQKPVGGPDRAPRQAARPGRGRPAVGAEVDAERRAADDAQPHRHPPAAPGAAQHRRRAAPPGGLARDARLPAFRLPLRPAADRGREARHRARGRGALSATTAR